jgi:hypothetical protein
MPIQKIQPLVKQEVKDKEKEEEEEKLLKKWEYIQQCDYSILHYQCIFTKTVIL